MKKFGGFSAWWEVIINVCAILLAVFLTACFIALLIKLFCMVNAI